MQDFNCFCNLDVNHKLLLILITRCMYLQCMPHVHFMTFEPTGDTCALLLVGVAIAFVTVSHVQQCDEV